MSASPCVDAVAHDFAMFGLLSNAKMRNIVKTYLLNTTSFSNPRQMGFYACLPSYFLHV